MPFKDFYVGHSCSVDRERRKTGRGRRGEEEEQEKEREGSRGEEEEEKIICHSSKDVCFSKTKVIKTSVSKPSSLCLLDFNVSANCKRRV